MNVLSDAMRVMIIMFLLEGMSIRSIERMTQVNRETIMVLLLSVGEGCRRLHDQFVVNLPSRVLQFDEQWSFVFKKEARLKEGDLPEAGDTWLFLAIDADSRLVIAFRTGKRSQENTVALVQEVRARVPGRVQITTDGFKPYLVAVQNTFDDASFAMKTKEQAVAMADAEACLRRQK